MPMGIYPRPTPEQRFWPRVEKTEDCWIWTGTRGGGAGASYGTLSINGRHRYVHRFSYELHVAPIPAGLTIDHLCRNKLCVRPDHLEPVTIQENLRRADMHKKACPSCGRQLAPRILARHLPACTNEVNACTKGHPFDEQNTYIWRGDRICRRCHADRERARRARARIERDGKAA